MKNVKTFEAFCSEYDNTEKIDEAQTMKDAYNDIISKYMPHVLKTKKAEFDKLGIKETNPKFFAAIINKGMKDENSLDETEKGVFAIFKGQADAMVKKGQASASSIAGMGSKSGYAG